MKIQRIKIYWVIFAAQSLIASFPIFSQSRSPNIGYVYPAGGKSGEELQVVVGGIALNGVRDARFSTNDISVTSAKFFNPFKNFSNDLKDELRPIIKALEMGEDPIEAAKKNTEKQLERLKKQAEKDPKNEASSDNDILKIVPGERLIYIDMTPEEVVKYIKEMTPLEYQCLCKEILTKPNQLQASPAIAQKVLVSIKISPNAKPGKYELRLVCANGASNPIPFEVSDYNEISEDYFTPKQKGKKILKIEEFPTVVNGEIMPGECDKLFFYAAKGESVSFRLTARKLVPFLGDAVPGWFQPFISVRDSNNNLLAYADDFYRDPDPVLTFSPTQDGQHRIEIRDAIYRGREDFVYRLYAEKKFRRRKSRKSNSYNQALAIFAS